MSIRSIGTSQGVQRPAAPATTAPAAPAESASKVKAGGAPRPRQDSVAISADARALATGAASAPASGRVERSSLSAERVGELRKKVLEGAYDQAHVVDQVAKRLLASGDV